MSKPQDTKNEQQKDLCITSEQLTEQWRKGELPSGWYYVKNDFGNIFPSEYSEDYDSINDRVIKDFFTEVSEIKEVIEQVPSYKQWQAKLEENTKLKELLKEFRHIISIEKDFASCHFEKDKLCKLLTKINQVLGEE